MITLFGSIKSIASKVTTSGDVLAKVTLEIPMSEGAAKEAVKTLHDLHVKSLRIELTEYNK